MAKLQNNHTKGLLLTAIGGMMLTFDIPLIKLAGGEPWTVLMIRSAATFIVALLAWAIWRTFFGNAPRLIPGRAGLVVTVLYGISSVAFVTAVFHTTTANLAFIVAFNTMFAALLSWVFLKKRPRPATLLAMVAMIGGIAIIVGDSLGSGHLFGDAMALLAAFVLASAITISRSSNEDMGFTALVGVILPCALALLMVSKGGFHIDAPWWMILNGAIVMPISFFCLAAGPRYLTGPEVAMFYLLETVLAPIWVWMIFAETPTRNSLIGGSIVIGALLAHTVWQLRDNGRRQRLLSAEIAERPGA